MPTVAELRAEAEAKGIDLPARAKKAEIEDLIAEAGLTVVEAVERDLKEIAALDSDLARSGHAAAALALARELDDPANSATSKSMCAKALNETLDKLRALAPPTKEADRVDDLAARRTERLARASGT